MGILNIGSLNIDRTYRVEGFVRPGETVKAGAYAEHCGGKGLNQSIAVARAGARVLHCGAVGFDGDMLLEAMTEAGVCCDYVKRVAGPSGHAVIQVDNSGQNAIIICGGANDALSCEAIDRALAAMDKGDWVLLQNETAHVDYAIDRAKELGLKVALNPSPMDERMRALALDAIDLLIVNELEAMGLAGVPDDTDAREAAACLRAEHPGTEVMLTLGSEGCCFFGTDAELSLPAFSVKAVDTTGAGDTFCGYFLAGIANGDPVERVLQRATAASALAVTKRGAAPSIPVRKDVDAFMRARS